MIESIACLVFVAALLWEPVREERARRRADREAERRRARIRALPLRSVVVDGFTIPSRTLAALAPEYENRGEGRTVQ